MKNVESTLPTKDTKKPKISKQKVEKKVEKKGQQYDMDDYELLLARHQLIQQQLQKVKGTLLFPLFFRFINII